MFLIVKSISGKDFRSNKILTHVEMTIQHVAKRKNNPPRVSEIWVIDLFIGVNQRLNSEGILR